MTHREFLVWLQLHLQNAAGSGLDRDGVRAIRDHLERMHEAGALQPFASKLFGLVREHATLDAKTVAGLATEVRSELAPAREQTVVSTSPAQHEK
jgi:hypothetical protein